MQYLLTEKEYNELQRYKTMIHNAQSYVLEGSYSEYYEDSLLDQYGKLKPFTGKRLVFKVNPYKVLELLDFNINQNIKINLISD